MNKKNNNSLIERSRETFHKWEEIYEIEGKEMGKGKQKDLRCAIHKDQTLTRNVNMICHKHEHGNNNNHNNESGERGFRDERREYLVKKTEKETRCVIHMYLLLKMNINFIYYTHVLIK